MNKTIFTALALATMSLTAFAQDTQPLKNILITQTDGSVHKFAADKVEGILFEETPDYHALNNVYLLGYTESDGSGFYHLELADGTTDAYGEPTDLGGMVVSVTLRAPKTADLTAPELPTGYFNPGNGKEDWTFDVTNSAVWIRWEEGDDGVSPAMILSGSIDVRLDDNGQYDVRMEFLTTEGAIDYQYVGPLLFPRGYGDYESFTADLDLTFVAGDGRFWGNWSYPFAADLSTRFWVGDIQNGEMMDGYILTLDFDEPKPNDCMAPNQRVADGTYYPENRENIPDYTYLPFRFNKGLWLDFMGTSYLTNSYITYTDPTGHRKLGLITGGSFTVSDNGTNWTFDLVTAEGISVKGSCAKAPSIVNYCDNDVKEPARPYSTLKDDHTLNWVAGTQALTYCQGPSIIDDANTLTLFICDPGFGTTGDFVQIDLLTANTTLENGTYQFDLSALPEHAINGCLDYGGEPIFSWYSNLDETDEMGYLTKLAPLSGGTITVSDDASGRKKIVFEALDDAGNTIRGEYVGIVQDITPGSVAAHKLRKNSADKRSIAPARLRPRR